MSEYTKESILKEAKENGVEFIRLHEECRYHTVTAGKSTGQ